MIACGGVKANNSAPGTGGHLPALDLQEQLLEGGGHLGGRTKGSFTGQATRGKRGRRTSNEKPNYAG